MAGPSRPRAFVSYRHIEYEEAAEVDALNVAHRQWVEKLACDLENLGVEVVFDGKLRELLRRHTRKDPYHVPFVAEVSTISSLVCHAFIPILTPSYVDRLGYAGYQPQPDAKWSFVQEEWQIGCFYCNAGAMQFVPIVRAGEPEKMAALPLGVGPENGFDMRDPQHYELQVRFIAQRILNGWDGDYPLIKVDLGEWVRLYLGWCRENYPGYAGQPVDEWQVDLMRPRLFLDAVLNKK